MIKNERQYKITKSHLIRFECVLADLDQAASEVGRSASSLEKQAIEHQADELRDQIFVYEQLQSGQVTSLQGGSLAELPDLLIKARIGKKLSQKQMAKLLGLKEQQIQRYEAEDYSRTSFARLVDVAAALDVDFEIEMAFARDQARIVRHDAVDDRHTILVDVPHSVGDAIDP